MFRNLFSLQLHRCLFVFWEDVIVLYVLYYYLMMMMMMGWRWPDDWMVRLRRRSYCPVKDYILGWRRLRFGKRRQHSEIAIVVMTLETPLLPQEEEEEGYFERRAEDNAFEKTSMKLHRHFTGLRHNFSPHEVSRTFLSFIFKRFI